MSIPLVHPDSCDFTGFTDREALLRSIYRYHNYQDSYYRSDLWLHAKRVLSLIQSKVSFLLIHFPELNTRKLQIQALVHDDVEIIIWDFQSANKVKMSEQELTELNSIEERGIDLLSHRFPREIETYSYKILLEEVFYKSTLESQIVKFFDHIDALCEALHEVYGGNRLFMVPPQNEYGVVPCAVDYYIPRFEVPEKHYPLLEPIFWSEMPFSCHFERIDFEHIAEISSPHTQESIKVSSWYPLYDWWKRTLPTCSDTEIHEWLLVESPWRLLFPKK